MDSTLKNIQLRFKRLSPDLTLSKYMIAPTLKEYATTLGGINFAPKNLDGTHGYEDFHKSLTNLKNINNTPAFAGKRINGDEHWALKLSFLATNGIGLRETYQIPSRKPYESNLPVDRGSYQTLINPIIPLVDVSTLHIAMGKIDLKKIPNEDREIYKDYKYICNIHIDKVGIALEVNGNVSLTPDSPHHLFNELVLKTNIKEALVGLGREKSIFDNISLILPNSTNNYDKVGLNLWGFGRGLGRGMEKLPILNKISRTTSSIINESPFPSATKNLLKLIPLPSKVTLPLNGRINLILSHSCTVHSEQECRTLISISGVND